MMPALSRRVALAAAGAAAIGGAPALAADPDAELLNLGAQWAENQAAYRALTEPYYDAVGFERPAEEERYLGVVVARSKLLRLLISRTPARTPAGLKVKATVLLDWVAPDGEAPNWCVDHIGVWSLCRDLMQA